MKAMRCWIGLVAAALWVAGARAYVVIDNFDGTGPDPNRWKLPYHYSRNGVLTQTNGRLEMTGSITSSQTEETAAEIVSKAVGRQDEDWSVMLDIYVGPQSDFSGITVNDIVGGTLMIKPSGAGGDDSVELNLGLANLGSGFDHVVRFGAETNGTQAESIVGLSSTNGVTLNMQFNYDHGYKTIEGKVYDPDTYSYLVLETVDTSSWGMGPDDVFEIMLGGGGFRLDEADNFGDYNIDSGELYFDNFQAEGDGITLIPEPHSAGLLLSGWAILEVLRRKRRRA